MTEKLELLEEIFLLLLVLAAIVLVCFLILEGMWHEIARAGR